LKFIVKNADQSKVEKAHTVVTITIGAGIKTGSICPSNLSIRHDGYKLNKSRLDLTAPLAVDGVKIVPSKWSQLSDQVGTNTPFMYCDNPNLWNTAQTHMVRIWRYLRKPLAKARTVNIALCREIDQPPPTWWP